MDTDTGTDVDLAPLLRELIGAVLRDERLAQGLRLVDVAERAGVSPQYLSEVERGLKDASSEMLAAIAAALDLDLGALLGRVLDTEQPQPLSVIGIAGGRTALDSTSRQHRAGDLLALAA